MTSSPRFRRATGAKNTGTGKVKKLGIDRQGTMTPGRIAWVEVEKITTYFFGWRNPDKAEPGPNLILWIAGNRYRAKPTVLNLTGLTTPELDAMQKLYNLAFDSARTVTEMRDQHARDQALKGDPSFTRVYRRLPNLVIKAGSLRDDGTLIHERLADDASGAMSALDSNEGNGDGESEVDESDEGREDTPQDDDSSNDQRSDVL